MLIDYVILLILLIVPLSYRLLTWGVLSEEQKYSYNKLSKNLFTWWYNELFFSFWFIIEIVLIIASIAVLINPLFEIIIYNLFFYFLVLQNIFVAWKFFRNKFVKPERNLKNEVLFFVCILLIIPDIIFILFSWLYLYIYLYISLALFLSPIIVLLSTFLLNKYLSKWVKK